MVNTAYILRIFRASNWLAVSAMTVMGCRFFRNPETLSDQARAARESESSKDSWVGQLDGFSPATGRELASSTQGRGLRYSGRDNGNMCVTSERDGQIYKGDGDRVAAGWLKEFQDSVFLFEMRDSLEIPKKAPWPTKPAARAQTQRFVSKEEVVDTHTRSDGTHWYTNSEKVVMEVCAPAAVPQRTSRYLTLTRFRGGETPAFYAWKLDPASVDDMVLEVSGAPDNTPATD